ncbi:MAG: hypothetical protein KDK12_15690 [Rhodobacteraceae bacterium]|nr:hypothetical protein [Paracoccaceae bacterium]
MSDEVARLKAAMWRMRFVLMQRRVENPSLIPPNQLAHYRWIIAQEKAGRVVLSGPVYDGDERPLGGMTLFNLADLDAARALGESDPFIVSGAMSYTLAIWQLNEGRLTLSVDLSDMTGRPGMGA